MNFKSFIYIIITLLFYFIVPEVHAKEQRFILENDESRLEFEFEIPENHIIYSAHKQSVGLPTTISLKNSRNLKSFQLMWPKPEQKISSMGKKIYFFRNHLRIPLIIEAVDKDKDIEIEADLQYVLCGEQCERKEEHISMIINAAKTYDSYINSVLSLILLATLGGFILNFMPCVLPVVSLKLIGIMKHPSADIKKALLSTIAGIITTFWAVALIAIFFKSTGRYFGFGLNFQEPKFIIALTLILTFFISSSLERVSIVLPSAFSNYLSNIKPQGKYLEHYFGGIIVTVLSTPCTAPFLGSALTLSFQQSSASIILTFSCIALGFSIPYIVLLIRPTLPKLLPKSGLWTLRLKKVLAVILIGTLLWLLTILKEQLGLRPAIELFLLLLLFKWTLESNQFLLKHVFIKFLLLAVLSYLSFSLPEDIYRENKLYQDKLNDLWQKFEPEKIQSLLENKKVIFIDITASWCLTCGYNKYMTLEKAKVVKMLSDPRIIAMRGDFTNHDPSIHHFLAQRRKHGLPYNVIFGPAAPAGIDLPIILSQSDIDDAINKASY